MYCRYSNEDVIMPNKEILSCIVHSFMIIAVYLFPSVCVVYLLFCEPSFSDNILCESVLPMGIWSGQFTYSLLSPFWWLGTLTFIHFMECFSPHSLRLIFPATYSVVEVFVWQQFTVMPVNYL